MAELSWTTLAAMLGLCLVGWAWHAGLAARELANRVAADTCREGGAQFLDGTVASHGLAFARDRDGRLILRRTYVFDYSEDGYNRKRGFVVVSGGRLDSVGLAPRAVH